MPAKKIYPATEVLWSSLERLGSRDAIADELGVTHLAIRAYLTRIGVSTAFLTREREIKISSHTKVCTKCGKTYPRTSEFFYTHVRHADGLHYYCKSCLKVVSSAVRETRPNPGSRTRYASLMKISSEETRLLSEYRSIILNDPCVYCGHPAEAGDHIQPLARGGEHSWRNLAPVCTVCNSSKRATPLLNFLLQRLESTDGITSIVG